MQSGPALAPGSLISDNAKILKLVFQDPLYAVYSAEATMSGEKVGITEYFPADLVARAPGGEVLLRSLELQDLFVLGRDRFIAEARALSALRHPNLLRFNGIVSDHGTACAFHAPEEGQSIMSLVKSTKQPLSQEEIDEALKPLVSALDFLHSKDLFHANITPDTILLRPAPLLIRFGAAKSYLATRMRKANLAVTPGYSAPELHFSDEKALGPLCDVFSLAAVLYYAVTGRHPINVIARGLGQIMPPAAARPSQRFRTQFLEAIDKGMELEPERRPPTIKAFGDMLLGVPGKTELKSTQPVLQLAANTAEGSQVHSSPPPARPHEIFSAKPKTEPQPLTPPVDDQDDAADEQQDYGSGWQDLGIGRLLALALVLALLVPAGVWMLEAQLKKEEQASVPPPPAGPEGRTGAAIKPASERKPAEAAAKRPPATVEIGSPVKEAATGKPRAEKPETIPPPETKHPQEGAPPLQPVAVATALCGLEERAGEAQLRMEGAGQLMGGADEAFKKLFAEGFIRQSCLVRDLHQKAEQLGQKIKEAEEKRDKAKEQMETRAEASSPRVASQKQDKKAGPETESASERKRLEATMQEQQSLMLTLSAERKRIEAEKIAAAQTLNERLKELKLARGFENTPGDTIDKPPAQPPANAIPLANAKKPGASKCADILSRLQLGDYNQSDLNALRQCELR